jgi:hypothetical protein
VAFRDKDLTNVESRKINRRLLETQEQRQAARTQGKPLCRQRRSATGKSARRQTLTRASIEVERYCITDDGPKALKE